MNKNEKSIPDWLLEKYILNELNKDLQLEIKQKISFSKSLEQRYNTLLGSNKEILSAYPPSIIAGRIKQKYNLNREAADKRNKILVFRSFAFAAAVFSVLFVLFLVVPAKKTTVAFIQNESTRIKSAEPHLNIYRQTEKGYEVLKSGAKTYRGDKFQIKYSAAEVNYGIIFSIDGRGSVTLHYPYKMEQEPALDKKGETALFEAFELDDAPSFERFFFITSKDNFKVKDIMDKGYFLAEDPDKAKKEDLDLPGNFNQHSFILLKEGYQP